MHVLFPPRILALALAMAVCSVAEVAAQMPDSTARKKAEKKAEFTARIKNKDGRTSSENLRDFYVARLSELEKDGQDPEVINLFHDLLVNEEDAWVRLEAAATVGNMEVPPEMRPRITAALENCRKDERVNFQVLASRSIVAMNKRYGKPSADAAKTLARIAQGQDMARWKVMIPSHNAGTLIDDPGTKRQIPFEDFFKTNLRLRALEGLALANDDFSRRVIEDLSKDGNHRVKETATTLSRTIR